MRKGEGVDRNLGLEMAAGAFLTASRALMGISLRSMAAAPVPLTVPQHRLLVLLSGDGARRVGALAEDLGVNQSNASRLVDRLVALELVRKVRDPEDGRASVVALAPAGRRLLRVVNDYRLRELREVVAQMAPASRAKAVEVLAEFNAAAHEQVAVPLEPSPIDGRAATCER